MSEKLLSVREMLSNFYYRERKSLLLGAKIAVWWEKG